MSRNLSLLMAAGLASKYDVASEGESLQSELPHSVHPMNWLNDMYPKISGLTLKYCAAASHDRTVCSAISTPASAQAMVWLRCSDLDVVLWAFSNSSNTEAGNRRS
jgi:hypothetical protein